MPIEKLCATSQEAVGIIIEGILRVTLRARTWSALGQPLGIKCIDSEGADDALRCT